VRICPLKTWPVRTRYGPARCCVTWLGPRLALIKVRG